MKTIWVVIQRVFVLVTVPILSLDLSLPADHLHADNFSFVAPLQSKRSASISSPAPDTSHVILSPQAMVDVAILSTSTFDATNVNPSTVRFGRTGTEAAADQFTLKDVNKDGRRDIVFTFRVAQTATP